jgi:hypothetical protein
MEFKVRIQPDGEVEVKVIGVQGEACLTLTKLLEKNLGEVIERELTSEFYERADITQHLPQHLEQ